MIHDFEDFVTWMFVIIDDIWQQIAPLYRRPGPAPTTCSDSALITVAVVSDCRSWTTETQLVQAWQRYQSLIPRLPERSRFNRRRRNLMGAINQIRQIVLTMLDVAQDAHGVIDSLPIPVVSLHLASRRSREWDAHDANIGYCASKKQYFFGYRLHLVMTLGGVILDVVLTPATGDEREVAAALLPAFPDRTMLGDKGYVRAPLAEQLDTQSGVQLIALRRTNQRTPLPRALTDLIERFRQIVETVNSQLTEQFSIDETGAHRFWGRCARLYTKLTAHTLCLYLNRFLGNPNWLQIKALAFPN
jgi:hypothetical protein